MKKQILIGMRDGSKIYGDYYESDDSPETDKTNITAQDLKEFVRVVNSHDLAWYELERDLDFWEVVRGEPNG